MSDRGTSMGRPEGPIDPDAGPVQRLAWELRELRNVAGRPSYRSLGRRAHVSASALAGAAAGRRLPSLEITLAYAVACGGDRAEWEARWRAAAAELEDLSRRCPYPGLAALQADQAEFFFGRGEQLAELLAAVRRAELVAVFGPSGSGKSSLLRAGLASSLIAAGTPVSVMTPGAGPSKALTRALCELPDGRGVLLVDQFEEVFTLCRDRAERDGFLDSLAELAETAEMAEMAKALDGGGAPDGGGARVVIVIRADFYGHCMQHPGLVAALRANVQVPIGPMSGDELREVILGPAAQVGLTVEADLVATVLAEAAGEPGALPLVAHALRETWNRHDNDVLRLAEYRAAGGVDGAIAQTAELLYQGLDELRQDVVRMILLRLTTLGQGTADTRRRVDRAELSGCADPDVVDDVLHRLAVERLIVLDRDTVDVAHEALVLAWPRLHRWLTDDRDNLRLLRRLSDDAAEWRAAGLADGFLYRGPRLAAWEGRELAGLNEVEHEFLVAARAREARQRTRSRRRTRLALGGLAGTAALVGVLAAVALVQADRAERERDLAAARQVTADARRQMVLDPELGLLLALRAYQLQPTAEADSALRQAAVESRLRGTTPTSHGQVLGLAVDPQGRQVATGSQDGTVQVWGWPGGGRPAGRPLVLPGHRGLVWCVAFSPDGRRVASSGADGTVRVWNIDGPAAPRILKGHAGNARAVAFSPDGRRLASVGDDGTIRLQDIGGGRPVKVLRHGAPAGSVAFSPDGHRIAAGGADATIRIWDLRTGERRAVLRGHGDAVTELAFSPDGRRLASASIDGSARIWQATGDPSPKLLGGHDGTVEHVTFSADGRRLATTGNDGTIRVWSAAGGGNPLILRGHRGTVWGAAFSPDGRWLVSGGSDGSLRVWDPSGPGHPIVLSGHRGEVWGLAYDRSGKVVAGGGRDGTVRIWDAVTGAGRPVILRGHRGPVTRVAIRPDGRQVAGTGEDGTVRLWPVTGAGPALVLRGHQGPARPVAYSPDGARLATGGHDGTIRLWDASGGRPLAVLRGHETTVRALAFLPDGRRLASGGEDGTIRLWDTISGRPLGVLRGHEGPVWEVVADPDGRWVASGGDDGTVRLWPAGHSRPILLRGHPGIVWGLSFSPDGRWLASAGSDGKVRLWRPGAATEPIVFSGFGATVDRVAFGPGADRLATSHQDGTVRIWRCEVCGPIDQIATLSRSRLTRSLTDEERRRFLDPSAR